MPASLQTIPKLAVLLSSGIAAIAGAACMRLLPVREEATPATA